MNSSICALATPQGIGALAIIRVSGHDSIEMVARIFTNKSILKAAANTIHYGFIKKENKEIDEVLISKFLAPHSFTGENSVEISCHGSEYIIKQILKLLVLEGCKMASPGEFTQRAFLNGKLDLAQAEAVADLIASDSASSHQIAINQLKGGFSKQLAALREELVHFASLIELELDFGEEDVTFADRDDLKNLIHKIIGKIIPLADSFEHGNAIKEGIPVAIIGPPNAGKSTLLNILLGEEKAIVTDIAGTTRDVIEDILYIEGQKYRFIDTAGIRETTDKIEAIGIERSREALSKAKIALMIYENEDQWQSLKNLVQEFDKKILWVQNKIDLNSTLIVKDSIGISAKENVNITQLKELIVQASGSVSNENTTITNLRHFEHLKSTETALNDVLIGLDTGITGDFLAQDIRLALHHLGEITGTITTDDLLKNIFGKFCIGK